MEAQAEPRRDAARLAQQFDGQLRRGPELAGQIIGRLALGHGKADIEAEIGGAVGRGDDLVDLLGRIEREVAHAIIGIGLPDEGGGLDRMHVVDLRLGEELANDPDLARGSTVEMPDAAAPQGAQDHRLGIALHGVENVAREIGDEAGGGCLHHMRADAIEGFDRTQLIDQTIDCRDSRDWQRDETAERPYGHSRAEFIHDAPSSDPKLLGTQKRSEDQPTTLTDEPDDLLHKFLG